LSPKQVTTKTVETHDEDEGPELQATPLFDRSDSKSKAITKISVRRTDPAEGHLGYLGPDASEAEIFAKWGGGEFVLQAKNDGMQIVKQTTIKLAGDPLWQSEIEEARWRRQNGLRPIPRAGDAGGSIKDVMMLIEEREAKRRDEERERRTEEKREQAEREERNRREQREHEEKLAREQSEREERRRRDETERDERRRQQHREDLDRVQAQAAATLAQTQQFFTQFQAMAKDGSRSDADPVKLLTAGMELALKLRGDGGGAGSEAPADALTTLLSRLPETLAEVRSTAKEAYHEIRGNGAPAARAALPAAAETGDDDDTVTITGATGKRLKAMIGVLQRAGRDPEEVIDGLASHVIGLAAKKGGASRPAAAATPNPSSSSARPSARPSKASRPSSSARPSARQPSKPSKASRPSSSARPSARPSKPSRPSSSRQMKNAST
jgi:hypothetical protein